MKVQSALRLAEQGFRVFPLVPNGRKPAIEDNLRKATADADVIRRWWSDDPDRNIGVATGGGIFVVDVDVKKGRPGMASLDLLEMAHDIPQSLRVTTTSGGLHLYLRKPEHLTLVSNADKVDGFPGLDIRAEGGYVVAPGSTIDGKTYTSDDVGIADAPESLFALLRKPIAARNDNAAIELDLPHNVERATAWLVQHAPHAVEGAGGDEVTYSVAAELRAKGVSEHTALDLMLEHWNEAKASPPWPPEDLATKVANAFAYGQGAAGGKTAAGEFEALSIDIGEPPRPADPQDAEILEPAKSPPFPLASAAGLIHNTTPPRQWLYGYMLTRKYVGVLASPGGVGKTAYTFAAALAMASGEAYLHDRPHKPLNVWLYNIEDDLVELQRRTQAVAAHYEAAPEVLSRITLTSGRDRPLQLLKMKDGTAATTTDAKLLADTLLANEIDVLILDPLVNAHAIPENDTEATAKLMRVVASIADTANCAILLVHHTRKGFVAGEADSVRGGSSIVANSRGAWTLSAMAAEDAKTFGIPEDQRKRYVKLDDAKANMSVSAGGARWMHLQSVALGNGDADYPSGDSVQVVVKWSPPQALDGLDQTKIRTILLAIEAGAGDGERFSVHKTGSNSSRWVGHMLASTFKMTEEKAKAFIKIALKREWIADTEYVSPKTRRPIKGIEVSLANVPETDIADLE